MKTVKMYHMSIQFTGIQLLSLTKGKRKKEMIHKEPGTLYTVLHSNYVLQSESWRGNGYLLSFGQSQFLHAQAINFICVQNNKQLAVPTWSKNWLCWTS